MTKRKKTAERAELGHRVKYLRTSFGYNRQRFAKMLGFTCAKPGKKLKEIEQGSRNISPETWALLMDWAENGLPADAPTPNLERSTKAFWERYNGQPRVIKLRVNS